MITDWAQVPLVFGPQFMASLIDVKVSTIWRRCQQRRMFPAPTTWERPWMWYRENVKAQLEAGTRVPIGRPKRRKPFERARERRESLAAAS